MPLLFERISSPPVIISLQHVWKLWSLESFTCSNILFLTSRPSFNRNTKCRWNAWECWKCFRSGWEWKEIKFFTFYKVLRLRSFALFRVIPLNVEENLTLVSSFFLFPFHNLPSHEKSLTDFLSSLKFPSFLLNLSHDVKADGGRKKIKFSFSFSMEWIFIYFYPYYIEFILIFFQLAHKSRCWSLDHKLITR